MKLMQTTLQKAYSLYKQHPLACLLGIFFLVWIITSVIFYLRFPNNFLYPNFFAEDGQIFTQNIIDEGFLPAVFTLFNGYFVCALYILTGFGFAVNALFFGNEFITLPSALAVISYTFFGLCCALPILLLKKYVSLGYRLAIALLLAVTPMVGFDYGTIGTIGNLKFAFAYLAVLLIMYRITLPRSAKRIVAIDVFLLLCAYTTASVYLLLPFILFGDGVRPKQLFSKKHWPMTFRRNNLALWSLLGLGVLALIQVVVVAINGVPKFPGYLDAPYQSAQTIELFIGRPILYPVFTWAYDHLNNLLVVLLLIALLLATWKYGNKEKRPAYGLCLFAVFIITAVFTINRTGVSGLFNDYYAIGPDNFFYAQNFIFIVFGVLLLADLARRFRWLRDYYIPVILVVVIAAGAVHESANYAPNNFMQYQIGTIQQQVKDDCSKQVSDKVTFSVYPFDFLTMTEPYGMVCTPTAYKHSGLQDFGLRPSTDAHLQVGPGNLAFNQTFTADANNLNGITVYLLTYYQTRLRDYTFTLKDAACRDILREVPMPTKVRDSAYSTINFLQIPDSKGKTYCFTVTPHKNAPELALGLSKEFMYEQGQLSLNNALQHRDVVFHANYRK